jgi:hypothetical protein
MAFLLLAIPAVICSVVAAYALLWSLLYVIGLGIDQVVHALRGKTEAGPSAPSGL